MASTSDPRGGAGFFLRIWAPAAAYVSMIFFLSAQPHLQPPLHFQNSDKLMHFGEYGGLGLLLARALRTSLRSRDEVAAALASVAVGMGIAAGDERFQSLIPGRECSLLDWFADSGGLVIAGLAFLALVRGPEA